MSPGLRPREPWSPCLILARNWLCDLERVLAHFASCVRNLKKTITVASTAGELHMIVFLERDKICFWGYDYKMVNRLRRETLVVFENHGISSLVL